MLVNPFTPSEIAAHPGDFFGRTQEVRMLERSLMKGSVAIRGAIGIGKSSLLAKIRNVMEGFDSYHKSVSAFSTAHKDIKDVDDAARLILESFVNVDEKTKKIKFKLGPFAEIEASEVCRYFAAGRHLAGLTQLMAQKYIKMMLAGKEYLILAIDEADKCPVALAKLIRVLNTHIQQVGVKNVRFVLAGVSPYFQEIVKEDPGVSRFFYKVITLLPMLSSEAEDLITTKLKVVLEDAKQKNVKLNIDPLVISRIVSLSGGHPHILQLMGAHLIEHENENPNGLIDASDLLTSLQAICYENRAYVYGSTIHFLELHNQLENLKMLFEVSSKGFPTKISRREASRHIGKEAIKWFIDNNILIPLTRNHYGLIDEFLRVRILLDRNTVKEEEEKQIIDMGPSRIMPVDEFISSENWGTYPESFVEDYE